jgi:hypothetical protein
MKRKLLLLNLALLALLVAGGLEFQRRVTQARSRYEILQRFEAAKETPPFPSPQAPGRVRQADYLPIVNRLLFYQDRNATVEVEAPAEKVVERPALPVLSGVMDFGEGPLALMADNPRGTPRLVAKGEKVGEYTFLGFAGDKLRLAWQGEEMEIDQERLAGELERNTRGNARSGTGSSGSSSSARRPAANRRQQASASETKNQQQPQAQNRKTLGGRYNIGTEIKPGVFRADPKDTSPAGTEYEGYRKVVNPTPFGNQSWWVRKDAQQQQPQQ